MDNTWMDGKHFFRRSGTRPVSRVVKHAFLTFEVCVLIEKCSLNTNYRTGNAFLPTYM